MALGFRPAKLDNATALSELMRGAILRNNAVDYPQEVITRLLARHTPADVAAMIATRKVLVASEGGLIVGTVALEARVMRGLFVSKDRQGCGVARALVDHVEDVARGDGIEGLSLQSSITAHGFYEKLGYRTQAFCFDLGGSTYRMIKRLPPPS